MPQSNKNNNSLPQIMYYPEQPQIPNQQNHQPQLNNNMPHFTEPAKYYFMEFIDFIDESRWVLYSGKYILQIFTEKTKQFLLNRISNSDKISNKNKEIYKQALSNLNYSSYFIGFELKPTHFYSIYTKDDIVMKGELPILQPNETQTTTTTQTQVDQSESTNQALIEIVTRSIALDKAKDTVKQVLNDYLELIQKQINNSERFKHVLYELLQIQTDITLEQVANIRKTILDIMINGEDKKLSATIVETLDKFIEGLKGNDTYGILKSIVQNNLGDDRDQIHNIFYRIVNTPFIDDYKNKKDVNFKVKEVEKKKANVETQITNDKATQSVCNDKDESKKKKPPIIFSGLKRKNPDGERKELNKQLRVEKETQVEGKKNVKHKRRKRFYS